MDTEVLEFKEMLDRFVAYDKEISRLRYYEPSRRAERRKLERQREAVARAFALRLGNPLDYPKYKIFDTENYTVLPYWKVEGVPSKEHKQHACEWAKMWNGTGDGSTQHIRKEVEGCLYENVFVPHDRFGLRVEWTIRLLPSELKRPHEVSLPTVTMNSDPNGR